MGWTADTPPRTTGQAQAMRCPRQGVCELILRDQCSLNHLGKGAYQSLMVQYRWVSRRALHQPIELWHSSLGESSGCSELLLPEGVQGSWSDGASPKQMADLDLSSEESIQAAPSPPSCAETLALQGVPIIPWAIALASRPVEAITVDFEADRGSLSRASSTLARSPAAIMHSCTSTKGPRAA
eukprot:5353861-Amphidinium_carterae.3